jgi:hypothetical protein
MGIVPQWGKAVPPLAELAPFCSWNSPHGAWPMLGNGVDHWIRTESAAQDSPGQASEACAALGRGCLGRWHAEGARPFCRTPSACAPSRAVPDPGRRSRCSLALGSPATAPSVRRPNATSATRILNLDAALGLMNKKCPRSAISRRRVRRASKACGVSGESDGGGETPWSGQEKGV